MRRRIGDECGAVGTVLRIDGNADGDFGVQRVTLDVDVAVERGGEPFGQRLGGRRLRPRSAVMAAKFVAPMRAQEGALAGLLQAQADSRNSASPTAWPKHVVDVS